MSGIFSDLPTSFVYAPYYILFGFTELVMWKCDGLKDAEKWAKYLRSRV